MSESVACAFEVSECCVWFLYSPCSELYLLALGMGLAGLERKAMASLVDSVMNMMCYDDVFV